MTHEFEVREEIALDATPEQVWEAISTGPGVDSWFMGRNEIEPGVGGTVQLTMAGYTQRATVTEWESGKRLAYRGEENPDGSFMAFEYLIEARAGGSTVLRFVHNGFLGDNWESEYNDLKVGDRMYLEKLAAYVKHFPGRLATFSTFLLGPQVADAERVWAAFQSAIGLDGTPQVGDPTRLDVAGLAPVEGVVQFLRHPNFLGVRTGEGIHMFVYAQNTIVVEYHNFAEHVDQEITERAWQSWLATQFG
jgi:uncharacterized protein YndB with AHSA1/START domain